MKSVKLLDCTLRDGGYCNEWNFGKNNIKKIIMGLEDSNIEIIECGFLSSKVSGNENCSRYTSLSNAESYIEQSDKNKQYVCMINYGEYDIDSLPKYTEGLITGIRVAFHKSDAKDALRFCKAIKEKGYKVFLQPMVIVDYSDEDFLELIEKANLLQPYAFYIVDSFGVMKKKELVHFFYMLERNLNREILIGFHSHNNMQLSYSNAQALLEFQGNREIIIDTSIFGMGRGAGNLNTELFEEYLNDNYGMDYRIEPLLSIYDDILSVFYIENPWGYSLANYLSAKHNCHPNYARFLEEKNTLTYSDINKIFESMNKEKKNRFDQKYIEKLYTEYMNRESVRTEIINDFRMKVQDKEVLVIASGMSGKTEKQRIIRYIKDSGCIVISVNMEYPYYDSDYIFISNIRRFRQIDKRYLNKMIVTSNVLHNGAYISLNYDDYTNTYEGVKDNASLMLISFLEKMGAKKIALAGMDGYSEELHNNYADEEMIIKVSNDMFMQRNAGMNAFLCEMSKKIEFVQVTTPRYISIEEERKDE